MHDTHVVDLGVKLQNLVEYPAFYQVTSPGQDSTVQLIAPLTLDFPNRTKSLGRTPLRDAQIHKLEFTNQTDSLQYRTLWDVSNY